MPAAPLLTLTDAGLYCPAGDFHVDPWSAVPRAIVTHAHGDHLAWGCGSYLTAEPGRALAEARLAAGARVAGVPYGEARVVNGVRVSLHPAGHILGSAQVRVEHEGQVWVVSGDYKTDPDPTCAPFEPVRCHGFITESTFGLPVYRWRPQAEVLAELNAWWRANREAGRTSVLLGYALGKAQRLLAGLDPSVGPIGVHGAVDRCTALYREAGVALPAAEPVGADPAHDWAGAMIVAPPAAAGSAWMRRFADPATAFASGWMQVRGARRRQGVDRGFTLSDHADWPGLLSAIAATGAEEVWVTHGYTEALSRWLADRGVAARTLRTRFEGGRDDPAPGEEPA